MNFQRAAKGFAPGYMSGESAFWMRTMLESVGAGLDRFAARSFLGRCAALPSAARAYSKVYHQLLQCEPDVLPIHARDRQITLFPREPDASRRRRLARWRQLHARRGTHRGELEYVQPYFLGEDGTGTLPRMRIVHQDGGGEGAMWHTLSGSYDAGGPGIYTLTRAVPSNFDFDGQAARWSRWWAIIYTSDTALESGVTLWDDGSDWDGGQFWDGFDGAITDDQTAMLIEWKAAHSQCAGLILTRDLASFDPTASAVTDPSGWTSLPVGNWTYTVDPTTGKPTRPPYASFLSLNL